MAKMKWYDWLMIALIEVGALNWGLVAWFGFNLVEFISGMVPTAAATIELVVYSLVGISAVVSAIRLIYTAVTD